MNFTMNRLRSVSFFVLIGMLTISCSKKLAPQDGLVGEYLFKSNALDNSKVKNHGEVHGATLVKDHKGKKKSAYHFNGTDQYIAIPHSDHTNFEHNQDFTISLWVSVEDQPDLAAGLNDIMRKWRGDTQGYPFAIVYYNNTAPDEIRQSFSFVRYDGSICRHSPQLYTPAPLGNSFVHLVCLKKGSTLRVYINTKLVAEAMDTTEPSSTCGSKNNSELTIGTRGNKVRHFAGTIDDVRFYNRALSQEEIVLLNTL